jgi:opacity protein-like surface antigen
MKNSFAVVLLLAVFGVALPAKAQDETSKFEVYGGYDFVQGHINDRVSGVPPTETFNANGGSGQLEYNRNKWLGIVGDLGGYRVTSPTMQGEAFSYLFGPRLNLRQYRFTPFAQLLLGGVLASGGIGQLGPETRFAMTAGGGIDYKRYKHITLRVVQAEYFMMKFPDGLNNRQSSFRLGAGIVFRFGRLD